jgi:hypothetical protein
MFVWVAMVTGSPRRPEKDTKTHQQRRIALDDQTMSLRRA